MNWLDIVILVMAAGSAFLGWRMGLVKGAVIIAGMAGGAYLGARFSDRLQPLALKFTDNENAATVIGFVVVFLIVLAVAYLVGTLFRKFLGVILLGWVDNMAGAAAGALIPLFLAAVLLSALGTEPLFGLDRAIEESILAPWLIENLPLATQLLPAEIHSRIPGQ